MQDREERLQREELIERHAPVGSPLCMARTAGTSVFSIREPLSKRSIRSAMKSTSGASNPNRITLPKYSEYQEEQPLYPHPLEDATRAEKQEMRLTAGKNMARDALLDQIKYNEIKRGIEKQSDLAMGLQMVKDAHESLQGEDTFKNLKRQKAAQALR